MKLGVPILRYVSALSSGFAITAISIVVNILLVRYYPRQSGVLSNFLLIIPLWLLLADWSGLVWLRSLASSRDNPEQISLLSLSISRIPGFALILLMVVTFSLHPVLAPDIQIQVNYTAAILPGLYFWTYNFFGLFDAINASRTDGVLSKLPYLLTVLSGLITLSFYKIDLTSAFFWITSLVFNISTLFVLLYSFFRYKQSFNLVLYSKYTFNLNSICSKSLIGFQLTVAAVPGLLLARFIANYLLIHLGPLEAGVFNLSKSISSLCNGTLVVIRSSHYKLLFDRYTLISATIHQQSKFRWNSSIPAHMIVSKLILVSYIALVFLLSLMFYFSYIPWSLWLLFQITISSIVFLFTSTVRLSWEFERVYFLDTLYAITTFALVLLLFQVVNIFSVPLALFIESLAALLSLMLCSVIAILSKHESCSVLNSRI